MRQPDGLRQSSTDSRASTCQADSVILSGPLGPSALSSDLLDCSTELSFLACQPHRAAYSPVLERSGPKTRSGCATSLLLGPPTLTRVGQYSGSFPWAWVTPPSSTQPPLQVSSQVGRAPPSSNSPTSGRVLAVLPPVFCQLQGFPAAGCRLLPNRSARFQLPETLPKNRTCGFLPSVKTVLPSACPGTTGMQWPIPNKGRYTIPASVWVEVT